jgi:hypothetical protein
LFVVQLTVTVRTLEVAKQAQAPAVILIRLWMPAIRYQFVILSG